MKKPKLLDQLIDDAKQSPITRDVNRVAILALLVEIKEALDAGW
jgi:hypothetical protein